MPARGVQDSTGEIMKLMDIDGYFLPELPRNNQEANFRSLKNWKARDDDIIICAYPKAGTHWSWEIVSMLINGKAERIPYVKEKFHMEFLSNDEFDSISSPRVLNSHLFFHQLPTDCINKKCKIVFVHRNPKDVAVSFYNHHKKITVYEYEGKWENYLQRFIDGLIDFGSWFDYTLDWEKVISEQTDIPFHVIHYENMKENSLNEVERLAKFLGVEQNLTLFKSIDDMCQFDKMKKEKDAIEETHYWKNKEPGMYRKGKVGDWKNWFTVNQNEEFNKIYEEKMKTSKLTFKCLL